MDPDRHPASLGQRVARAALVAVALWYLGTYLVVALLRIGYPYDLEWMEGGMLEHVARVLGGQPLYGPPSLAFTPYLYAPLYYYLAAPVAKLLGLRLLSLRLLSFAASLGVFAVLAALVRVGTRSRLGQVVAVGLFAALFKRSGAFFDLGRVDALALFLTLLGIWLLLASERHDVAAGALLAAAFFTKQSALLIGAPVVLARTWSLRGPRRLWCLAAFAALAAGGSALLHLRTGGWSTYYLFALPASHPRVDAAWVGFWSHDLIFAVPIPLLAFLIDRARSAGTARPIVLAAVLGALADGWSSRLHSGGYSNVLMPAYACLAWQAGTVLGWLHEPPAAPGPGPKRRTLVACARWACLIQLALLWYRPWRQVPTSADRAAGDALVARLAATPGPVLVPFHPHLARLAGKPTYSQQMALSDVMRGGNRQAADLLAADVRRRLGAREFGAVVLDHDWWPEELEASYIRSETLFPGQPDVFWPVTGWPTRPRDVYQPRPVNSRTGGPAP